MNFLKHTYFGNTVNAETQTDPPVDYANVVQILHGVYSSVYPVESLRGQIETLQSETNKIQKENAALRAEIQELKDTIHAYKTRDYVSKYHLLRQGKAFPFTPVLSKSNQ